MRQLPDMTIEKRESTTPHSVPAPEFDMNEELRLAIILNEDAKYTDHANWWRDTTLDILEHYLPFQFNGKHIPEVIEEVFGFNSWNEVCKFVVDDMCLDFFNIGLDYCLREGQNHKKNKGFIDGSGIGYATQYIKRLKQTLEQCFDAKYFYKIQRPLVFAEIDLSYTANAIHPGHWSYPAGHGTKFLTAVEVLDEVFHLDDDCRQGLLVAACVAAMGRSGSLIHYPADNLAGGYLTTLPEWHRQ